ncbi:inositol monophosphatase family protein [Hyphococcus formosus]|uniref:inositol monophosphatase family protein n=1 Tax=Hyphococcus formosus TaxID=3143534 RepID=UPI00398B4E1C
MHFSPDELSTYAEFAEKLADAARKETLARFRNGADVSEKSGPVFDPVTDADREAELVLRQMIQKHYPDHGILGEEFGEVAGSSPWRWVLDPIDGTRAFMSGAPSWTTLIGLEYENKPVFGLIDQPYIDERWTGMGANARFCHRSGRKEIRTSGLKNIADARISTTDPLPSAYFSKDFAKAFLRVADAARVARFSLDAYAYGLLALGEVDIVIETGLQRYDYAALLPVVRAAGGVVSNWNGEEPGADDRGELVASASQELHEATLKLLRG